MPCDPQQLLNEAACFQCTLTGDLFLATEIVLLCAIRDGETVPDDVQELIAQANCIRACIPIGMMNAVKVAILCDIMNG